jgi:hypothetical protein
MATGAFKDLVIDAVDAQAMAAFWSRATGLTAATTGDGPDAVLRGAVAEHTIWINQVPEPVTVKQRVHLDLHVGALEDLTALGATIDTRYPQWTVMRDPEGGELCAFVRSPDRLPAHRVYEFVVDSPGASAIASWWGELFDLAPQQDGDESSAWLEGGSLPFPMIFQQVPEPKQVKNRIHWDVWGDTADYLAAGATLLRGRDEEISWDVLADPDGNEFCVFGRD